MDLGVEKKLFLNFHGFRSDLHTATIHLEKPFNENEYSEVDDDAMRELNIVYLYAAFSILNMAAPDSIKPLIYKYDPEGGQEEFVVPDVVFQNYIEPYPVQTYIHNLLKFFKTKADKN